MAGEAKYALLVAIADLAVQLGTDDGAELDLPLRSIAEQFIKLYWRHSAPYGIAVADDTMGILIQNNGKQAKIIPIVTDLQRQHAKLMRAKESPAWRTAVSQTVTLIKHMPLWRLQLLGNETIPFLYDEDTTKNYIRLKHGVAANFRRFHSMIIRTAQSEWLHYIQGLPQNSQLLGTTSDLEQFLLGAERSALNSMTAILNEVQKGRCLYCDGRIIAGPIDHFVPWSRYPRDLAHNLVLADDKCNRKKSDLLASETHLERWLLRNADHGKAIADAALTANIIADNPVALSVAAWAYSHGQSLGARAWISGDLVEALSGRWRSLLSVPVAIP